MIVYYYVQKYYHGRKKYQITIVQNRKEYNNSQTAPKVASTDANL